MGIRCVRKVFKHWWVVEASTHHAFKCQSILLTLSDGGRFFTVKMKITPHIGEKSLFKIFFYSSTNSFMIQSINFNTSTGKSTSS